MEKKFHNKNSKRKLNRQERRKKYYQPKPATLWDMLDNKSRNNLLDVKARIIMKKNDSN
ncbi:unnamed protein product [marine sediment metagenome]|uniref:Uncharacterized protein n=1 Tax=marine sediment metagenome TaxID=412755 RepID=X0WB79_9ZZZZ